jgi:hypothetical protein
LIDNPVLNDLQRSAMDYGVDEHLTLKACWKEFELHGASVMFRKPVMVSNLKDHDTGEGK